MTSTSPRWRESRVGGCLDVRRSIDADGTERLSSPEALQPYPQRYTDRLEHWARTAPDRVFVAQRGAGDDGAGWNKITYAQMLDRAQRIGQALLDLGLSVERPLAVLSDNDLEHASLALGAMWAGIPYAPISSAYSLVAQDYAKLRHIAGIMTPGAVYASDPRYERAISQVFDPSVAVILGQGALVERPTRTFRSLLDTAPGDAVRAAHDAVGPDTIAKFLFTSGSTKAPKGVVNTNRMLCASQQQIAQSMVFLADEPPVLVDWLPWNHTFGGNQNFGLTLYHGGTLHIDEGKPTPKAMWRTIKNLQEIAPTIYFNVPKGFEDLAAAMEEDDRLRESLFSRVKAFMFAGAGLSQPVWDQLDRLAERTVGARIPIITGLGMTETAPACLFALVPGQVQSGDIGLPMPGVEVKLVRDGDGPYAKSEIRFRGPNVMPGYWRDATLTAEAFDADGYYRTGDAARWIDPGDIRRGLRFDGRIAEDFKLSSGTFVSVGPMRAKVTAHCAPCVQDVVLTGLNADDVGALLFLRLDECRKLAGLGPDVDADEVVRHPAVHGFFQSAADHLYASGTGSASRVARMLLLPDPPSLDAGEVTDKGSINQRAVLVRRADTVTALHAGTHPDAILPRQVRAQESPAYASGRPR